jgi:hypothetical protein
MDEKIDLEKEFERIMKKEEAKQTIAVPVSEYAPEVQMYKKIDMLSYKPEDAYTDVQVRQVVTITALRAFHEHICKIPVIMTFLDEYLSLIRSRDRMGRQELVEILKKGGRLTYEIYPYELEEEPEGRREGFISRIGSLFRRRR